jgi:DNA-nicking Smr family endonuclease
MKKRKQPEQGRPEFNNNPFSSLKKLKPAITAPPQQPAKMPARKVQREDEEELFQRAMSGARRLAEETEETPAAPKRRPEEKRPAGDPEEQRQFLQAIQKMGSTLRVPQTEEELDELPRRSASNRMKQLKRGALRISGELDLHGCLREEALMKLKQFLAEAQGREQKTVLIITGKGINSPEGPVLQGAVADWLREKGQGLVAEFGPAPRDKGGSGAFVVFLKSK